jgi:hypothetical protein
MGSLIMLSRVLRVFGAVLVPSCCLTAQLLVDHPAVVGHWAFDGSIGDGSGRGNGATAERPRFVPGRSGQALDSSAGPVYVADHERLRLEPGLRIDCWIKFAEQPTGYQHIFIKDKEYQLRVDSEKEGGCFSFFVNLNGWEPRVRSKEPPRPGVWYHLVAGWDGVESSLEVNGEVSRARRSGAPSSTKEPLRIGVINGVIDEFRIENPNALALSVLRTMLSEAGARTPTPHFGGDGTWPGWIGVSGGTVSLEDGALAAALPDSSAMVVNPTLDIDIAQRGYVSCDISCDRSRTATLTFITDTGHGTVPVSMWGHGRTTIIDLAMHVKWRGRLKLLALAVPGGGTHRLNVENLWVSGKPEGKPYLYVRNLAPGRAILRVGREETIVGVVRSLGAQATGVKACLTLPSGVVCEGEAVRELGVLPTNATQMVTWRVRAMSEATGRAEVCVTSAEGSEVSSSCPVTFLPPCTLRTDYVPVPRPAETDYLMLMHYCPLWKEGTHYGWERIEPWPERRPAIGYYDEGTGVVADWQIKYALEHGIQGFIYCWYREDFSPEIHQHLPHGIHEGLFNATYLDRFQFTIMWENGCAKGVKGRDDLMNNVFPFWLKNYFLHPSYAKVDNKPVLFVWRPERVRPYFGSAEATRSAFDEMRQGCRQAGFDGLWIVGCVTTSNEALLRRMAEEGWDASSAYATQGPIDAPFAMDCEGIPTIPHAAKCAAQAEVWRGKKAVNALPDIVSVMMGWDPRPWHGPRTSSYQAGASPENFRGACLTARDIIEKTPGNGLDKRMVVFDNWNEFGEGHYLEPCVGFGFQFVDAIREVFCKDSGPCNHVIPEDVGLAPPEQVYAKRRAIMGGGDIRKRVVKDHLIAWWSFDDDSDALVRDSSACRFDAAKQKLGPSTPGVKGNAVTCGRGSAAVGDHHLLYPREGITIEAWIKTDTPDQFDRWILNAVGRGVAGYRLGLSKGRLSWQIPQTSWSHNLIAKEPLSLGEWHHVAATYDNETMRIFVDGFAVGQLERRGIIVPSARGLCLGSYAQGSTRNAFIGWLDEAKIYDRALSAAEIARRSQAR